MATPFPRRLSSWIWASAPGPATRAEWWGPARRVQPLTRTLDAARTHTSQQHHQGGSGGENNTFSIHCRCDRLGYPSKLTHAQSHILIHSLKYKPRKHTHTYIHAPGSRVASTVRPLVQPGQRCTQGMHGLYQAPYPAVACLHRSNEWPSRCSEGLQART